MTSLEKLFLKANKWFEKQRHGLPVTLGVLLSLFGHQVPHLSVEKFTLHQFPQTLMSRGTLSSATWREVLWLSEFGKRNTVQYSFEYTHHISYIEALLPGIFYIICTLREWWYCISMAHRRKQELVYIYIHYTFLCIVYLRLESLEAFESLAFQMRSGSLLSQTLLI
jgi:hypothetical protein